MRAEQSEEKERLFVKIHKIDPIIPKLKERKKVAAYARVSFLTDKTQTSLSTQVSYYSSFIQNNPEWEYAGVYIDEGITGTAINRRKGFQSMIRDCDDGKIDLILTKSVSRFARNTVDTLTVIRHLKEIGIDVYFERENIHTISHEGELLLTLLSAFAQAESQSLSENEKWRIRNNFKLGIPNMHKAPYGYEWNGEIYSIIPEQGEIVKEIYKRYLEGESAYKIAKILKKRGIKGQSGVPMDDSTMKYILSNISYTGTLLLQKHFITEDHKRKRNKGELPKYAVDGMFEPLVSKTDFEQAQIIMKKRAESMPNKNPKLTVFSGIIKCANCGHSISRRTHNKIKKWVCNTKERKGISICDLKPIYEIELEYLTMKALNMKVFDVDVVKEKIDCIWLDNAYITFVLKNGKKRKLLRMYTKGYSGFSRRLFCGFCGGMLEADTRILSINGEKKKYKIWVCQDCCAPREFDDTIRKATQSLFNEKQCEGLFAQYIKKAINYEDRIEFYFKEGKVITWKKK